jgi:hypothetical protein
MTLDDKSDIFNLKCIVYRGVRMVWIKVKDIKEGVDLNACIVCFMLFFEEEDIRPKIYSYSVEENIDKMKEIIEKNKPIWFEDEYKIIISSEEKPDDLPPIV